MGNKKTQLMRGDRYGLLKAAELAAELIGDYERGRDGASSIRVESLDDDAWDDIEVNYSTRIDRWQVKRLKEKLEAADALKLLETAVSNDGGRRRLGVAAFVPITDGAKLLCDLRDVAELCDEARTLGTDARLFVKQCQRKKAFKFIKHCLPTGATDSVALAILQDLHVEELGLERALRDRAHTHLRDLFTNAETVVEEIFSWFLRNPSGAITVDAALLHGIVERVGTRDPARPQWIHLERDPVRATWACRGPVTRDDLIERSWGSGNIRIQLATAPRVGEQATAALARLALHRVGSASMQLSAADASEWDQHSATLCGATLGKNATPVRFGCQPLALATPPHAPRLETDSPSFAAQLNGAMDQFVWEALVTAVDEQLTRLNLEDDLRSKMRTVWSTWHTRLNADSSRRAYFLRSMLATVEEWTRAGFNPSLRLGPGLIEELGRTTIVALAITAVFQDSALFTDVGTSGGIHNLALGEVPTHILALSVASHPEERTPYRIVNAAGPMLTCETGLAILGTIDASARDLFDVATEDTAPFHASALASQNFRHSGPPPPVLTANPRFYEALSRGMTALRSHLAEMLGGMNHIRLSSLRSALNGGQNV